MGEMIWRRYYIDFNSNRFCVHTNLIFDGNVPVKTFRRTNWIVSVDGLDYQKNF